MRIEIITIGDEILIGQTVDTNSAWLGQALNSHGLSIDRILSIRDTASAIKDALDECIPRADLILVTGGLGPTKDDLTKHTLNNYFKGTLVLHDETLKRIERAFAQRGIPMLQSNKDQALVPDVATVLPNRIGTAPGMWFERDGCIVVSMPGVPYEMQGIMTDEVFPRLKGLLGNDRIVHCTLTVINVPESILSERLTEIEAALPAHLKLAYLPHLNVVRLRLTAVSDRMEYAELEHEVQSWMDKIRSLLGKSYYEGDVSIAQAVGSELEKRGLLLGTIESCTGGFVSHSITRIPGSSRYFRGGLITYANELKSELLGVDPGHFISVGSVSREVAEEMAHYGKERLCVDYCISITGIAGPTGATDTKPVGLVFIGLARPDGSVIVTEHRFKGGRMQVIERSCISALEQLRQALLGD